MPLRILLTGLEQTPSVDALVAIFPREMVLKRLTAISEARHSPVGSS
jgi:glutamyl-tRNA synthetase